MILSHILPSVGITPALGNFFRRGHRSYWRRLGRPAICSIHLVNSAEKSADPGSVIVALLMLPVEKGYKDMQRNYVHMSI